MEEICDTSRMKKLKEEYEKGLNSVLQQIVQWEKYKSDYKALQERLETFADKLSYDIMVPFGSHAFMPGNIIHTNCITVLLGDNWFADVSAKQASQIVHRRLKQCEKMLKGFDKEKEEFKHWLSFISEIKNEDSTNIVEIYDPEKEKLWRDQHAQNVREYNRKKALEKALDEGERDAIANIDRNVDDYYLARLNELELEEKLDYDTEDSETEKNDEETDDEDDDSNSIDQPAEIMVGSPIKKKKVPTTIIDDLEEISEKCLAESVIDTHHSSHEKHVRWIDLTDAKCKKITIHHTTPKKIPAKKQKRRRKRSSSNSDFEEEEEKSVPIINSPSDIYKCFSFSSRPELKPRSILKPMHSDNSASTDETIHTNDDKIHSSANKESSDLLTEIKSEKAFTGEICEHKSTIDKGVELKTDTRPKSLFKSSRQTLKTKGI